MVFVWNISRPRKSKQPSQFWPISEWSLYEILLYHENRSNPLNFDPFLNGLCMKSYKTQKIEATFSILIRFRMVFVWNPTTPRKSKQPSQFWPVFERFLYEVLLDHVNRRNFFNSNSFLNGFCIKSYQTTQIEATFSILTRFLMVFVWNPTRPPKSKQPSQFWLVFEWFLNEIYQTKQIEATFLILTRFWMVFCMKSY